MLLGPQPKSNMDAGARPPAHRISPQLRLISNCHFRIRLMINFVSGRAPPASPMRSFRSREDDTASASSGGRCWWWAAHPASRSWSSTFVAQIDSTRRTNVLDVNAKHYLALMSTSTAATELLSASLFSGNYALHAGGLVDRLASTSAAAAAAAVTVVVMVVALAAAAVAAATDSPVASAFDR